MILKQEFDGNILINKICFCQSSFISVQRKKRNIKYKKSKFILWIKNSNAKKKNTTNNF